MVEIEPSAQTLPPLNVGGQAHRRWWSLQELVVESLVVSLAMVVVDVLAHEETQVGIVRLRVQVAQWTDEQPDTELSRLPIPA